MIFSVFHAWMRPQTRAGGLLPTGLVLLAGLVLFRAPAAGQPSSYEEAPALAKQVEAGSLPPVEERLPEDPLVVTPNERVGSYGGTWTYGMLSSGQFPVLYRNLGWEHLVRWNPNYRRVEPNIAKSWEVNEGGTEYTFHLREGMRWSDGAPFTAEDVAFYYNHVVRNDKISHTSGIYTQNGKPIKIEKVDRYTIKVTLREPDSLFLRFLAGPYGSFLTRFPKHYLKQFHKTFNPEGIDELVRKNDASDWVDLFSMKAPAVPYLRNWVMRPDLPNLHAWRLKTAYGEGTRVVAERNPYYWKVDPEGNQLPYIDRVVHRLFGNQETILLRTLNGELDFMWNNVNSQVDKSLLYDGRESGGYHFVNLRRTRSNYLSISFNLTHPDSIKREIFNRRAFRIGLSHAINRQEILNLVYMGRGEPRQVAPMPSSPLYNEQLAQQYVSYDVEKANRYVDRAGLDQRDDNGFRLGPNGKRFTVVLELTDVGWTRFPEVAELLRHYWRAVGIDIHYRLHNRDYFFIRRLQNKADAYLWKAPGGRGADVIMDPKLYMPFTRGSYPFVPWGLWVESGGQMPGARRPKGPALKQVQLYRQLRSVTDREKQREYMRQILQIAADEFYTMGIASQPGGYAIVANTFHNVPDTMNYAWKLGTPAAYNPCQFYIERPSSP